MASSSGDAQLHTTSKALPARSPYDRLSPATSTSMRRTATSTEREHPPPEQRLPVNSQNQDVGTSLSGHAERWQEERHRWSSSKGQTAGALAPLCWPEKNLPIPTAPALVDRMQAAHFAYRHAPGPSGGSVPLHFYPERFKTCLGGRNYGVLVLAHDYSALHENELETTARDLYPLPVHRTVGPSARARDLEVDEGGHLAIYRQWCADQIFSYASCRKY